MQNAAAMLAVYGVDVVRQQPAIGALEADLVGTENRLKQAQEQPDAHEHDHHREQPPARPSGVMSPKPVVVSVVMVK